MKTQPEINDWVESHSAEILQFLATLVQIRSDVYPPEGNELKCQQYIRGMYEGSGAQTDFFMLDEVKGLRTHPAFWGTWDGMERSFTNRPDVVGVYKGTGDGKSLLISTHVDTVPLTPEQWRVSTPLSGEIIDGKMYGRGSWDTKWGIACGFWAVACLRDLQIPLQGDVILESVCDEEFGGSHGTLAARLRGYQADFAINCEPTSLVVAPAHHGGSAWRITVKGEAGMSFTHRKLQNPVYKIASVIEAVKQFEVERSAGTMGCRYFEDQQILPAYTLQLGGGGTTYAEAEGIPAECYLIIWVEELPGVTFEQHRDTLVGAINHFMEQEPDFDGELPEYRQLIRYLPGSSVDANHPFFSSMEAACGQSGIPYQIAGAPFACDTYVFNLHSPTSAITLGPRGGNVHAGDEFVLIEDILSLTKTFAHLIVNWCNKPQEEKK